MAEDRLATLVRDAALLLSSNRSLIDVFDDASALLGAHLDASIVLIFLLRDGELRCEYASLAGKSGVPDHLVAVRAESTVARVYRTGEPVRYTSESDWTSQRLVSVGGFARRPQSALFVPIVVNDATIGVLSVQSTTKDAYRAGELQSLQRFAFFVGKAVEARA
jgi:transcriptional regulator with GAF, ATPase, and Fis domain